MSPPVETRLERRPVKKPRACRQCHSRKVRCDAWQVGIPCTRCRRRDQSRACVYIATEDVNNAGKTRLSSNAGHSTTGIGFRTRSSHQARLHRQRPDASREALIAPTNAQDAEAEAEIDAEAQEQSPFSNGLDKQSPEVRDAARSEPAYGIDQPLSPCTRAHAAQQPLPLSHMTAPSHLAHSEEFQQPPDLYFDATETAYTSTRTSTSVDEDDVHMRVAEDISRGGVAVVSPSEPNSLDECCEILEYHEGVTPVTILGEAFGKRLPNRLTRVKLRDAHGTSIDVPGASSIDTADNAYLEEKGALRLPSARILAQLIRLYFSCVYPYAPILDPVQFVRAYRARRYSMFLMQCIIVNVIPHAPMELLNEMGYQDRMIAQKQFYRQATLVYDLGHVKSQLVRLQGSIMLSSLSFSYAVDKDYRYWFSNACRVATQIGLHRQYIYDRLDITSRRLFRRIWWTLYNRDVLLVVIGLSNLRKFDDRFCDTALLTEDDWGPGDEACEINPFIPATTRLQKVYMLENCKLSLISSHFIEYFKMPGKEPTAEDISNLELEIAKWKKQLDPEVAIGTLQQWSSDNIWILVLLALSFHLEAVFYRAQNALFQRREDQSAAAAALHKQQNAIFELSTMIQRASLHQVVGLCPLSFMTCASTILAMRIEMASRPNIGLRQKLTAKVQIFTEIDYLREACHHWSSLKWTLRMFEAAIKRMGLGIDASLQAEPITPALVSATLGREAQSPFGAEATTSRGQQPMPNNMELDLDIGMFDSPDMPGVAGNGDFFGFLPMTSDHDWTDSLYTL